MTTTRRQTRQSILVGLLCALAQLCVAGTAGAQSGPDLNVLALDWARGRYSAPLMCTFEGEPVRGMRRVLVAPGSRNARPPVGRLVFVDLEVEEAARCFTAFGDPAPNLRGNLQIRLPATSHPDTAHRDFAAALRRNGGFDFDIVSGALQVQEVGEDAQKARWVDFRGGEASLRKIAPGSDAARLLAEFPSPRKVHLKLENRDGVVFELDMILSDLR